MAAILVSEVVRLLVIDLSTFPPGAGPSVFLFALLSAFFLPFLWWRTTIGYIGAVFVGIIALVGQAAAAGTLLEAGVENYLIIIPTFVFALLLIGASVLAWREG